LTELRAADLRFTPSEAAEFLNQMMGLNLSAENIATLEARTEGWIAGLQLAAISMQGQQRCFRVYSRIRWRPPIHLDYLVEEVLQSQPESYPQILTAADIHSRSVEWLTV
jgi:LuxR family transcriptional regulator, maltose regulon positive regulatory protein